MQHKIIAILNNETQFDMARSMAPSGAELQLFTRRDAEKARAAIANAEYMIATLPPFDVGPEFFAAAPKLKLIQALTAGYDKWDLDAAAQAGVLIATNGGANSAGVAEHAIMLMLALKRNLLQYHADVLSGKWWKIGEMPPVSDLAGQALGIVGFNSIGRKLARIAAGFGMRVIYSDVVRLPPHEEDALGVTFRLLPELLRDADIVSLHVPLLPSTSKMIGTREFGLMKPSAILINTARGPVVEEAALIDALTSGRIAGAGLDVLEKEPPDTDNPLFNMPNVVLTPHQAGHIFHYGEPALRNAFLNIGRMLAGAPANWVVPELRG